jgi:hypothetical protein
MAREAEIQRRRAIEAIIDAMIETCAGSAEAAGVRARACRAGATLGTAVAASLSLGAAPAQWDSTIPMRAEYAGRNGVLRRTPAGIDTARPLPVAALTDADRRFDRGSKRGRKR